MADIKNLLAELGGDNPQNRAIAEGLAKQGIKSTKDIEVRKVPVAGHFEGTGEAEYYVPETTINAYFNKSSQKEIDPTRIGIYDVKDGDKTQGNIFFHLDADDGGNVSFRPQWSPRSHGFLRDNAVGRLIMTAGKIIPSPFQAGFVAADVADKLAHGKVMQAVASAIPYGIQEFAKSAELLQNIAGNSDFVATAKTAAGKIAEAAGAPSYAADLAGKVATSGITAGLTGGDVGKAMLKAGAGSILGQSKDFLKTAGDFSKSGIGSLIPEGVDVNDFDPEALAELGETLEEVDLAPKGEGIAALQDTRLDENGLGDDLAVDMRADENGIGSLNSDLEGGAGKDYVSPEGEGMVDDAGDATDKADLGTVTVKRGWNSWEGDDNIDENAPLTLPPGAEPDEVDLEEEYLLNPDDPYSKLELPPGAEPDETKPEEPYLLNPDDPYSKLELPPGAEPDEVKPEEPYLLKPEDEPPPKEPILKVPPIFPPKVLPKEPTPKGPGGFPLPKDGLDDIVKGLVGGTVVGKVIDGLTKDPDTTTPALADPLKGNYNFSWNRQETKGPQKGVAYSQKYYGNQWTKQSPEAQVAKAEQPEKLVALPAPVDPVVQDMRYIPSDTNQTQFAEGGLMSLGGPMFNPTMTDSGISAGQLSKDDITGQAIQHMRKGGHVIDEKAHKEVSYLAGKGEPVHHIVGFMNHRKRMAEGGITSHSLGSYSDGGHLLKGPGDGMSDDIPATIADKQPARLANEEFVIPADVVSHLGNGSSESGAKVLYEMMARIRKARTGNPKQGKQINPHKLMPKV
jgi:hypothetical protein